MDHERFADGDNTLLGSGDGALQHEVVVLDDTIVGEATHRRDRLVRDVRLRRSIALISARANTVNLLVELRTVVVAVYRIA